MKQQILYILLITGFTSCKDAFRFDQAPQDEVIVKVGDKMLFKSQLEDLVHQGVSASDSVNIISGFTENWIRENLMIMEAEKNVASDIDINKLMADYRASLLVYNYEKKLIEEKLDTMVTENQKFEFYENNKSQFLLSHRIYQCVIAVFPDNYNGLKSFSRLLKNADISEAIYTIKEKAKTYHIDLNKWYTREEILSLLPPDAKAKTEFSKNDVLNFTNKGAEYYVKILNQVDENQVPPLEYIEDRILKVILNNRKTELLKNIRKNLYEKAVSENKIKIYN
ncbi:MAG: hypothetical protein IPM42_21395 [Saprospiraceae bacterium]|nr:hypothetical protein [Saprospiraceae bacterium]